MTIGKKLTLAFASVLAMVMALGYIAISSQSRLGSALDEAVSSTAKKMDLAGAMRARVHEMVASTRGAQLGYVNGDIVRAEANRKKVGAAAGRVAEQIAELRPLLRTEAGRDALAAVENGLQQLKPLNEQYLELGSRKQFAEAHQFMNAKILPVVEAMVLAGDALTKQQRTFLAESQREADAGIVRARWMTLGAIGASFLVGALVLLGIRGITGSLRKVAEELALGAQQTASAAAQVAAASQSMAQGSSEQAASLEETSASSEEIHSVAKRNADSSRAAAGLMSSSQERFRKASEALGQTVGAMNEINVQSEKISKIIQVIDGIAFQTNILALNAAVEAARAGQAGLGFAVVADEVRNLAQRCAQAARDTAELIEESMAKSRDGKSKVDSVTAALQGVAEESTRVKTMVDEVSVGSEEQARGLDEIRRAITQMEQVTQASAANAEESAAAAEELNAQTETVKSVAMQLTVMVGAG